LSLLNIAISDFNTAKGQLGVSHCFPSLIKENVGCLAQFIMDVAYRIPGNSVAVAYLPPSVLKRPNLTVAVNTVVERVLFDESGSELRAIGVEVSKSQVAPKYRIKANREVIICGGTIASPHILLVSGIGPKEVLSKAGIKVVKDLPQVGKNYCDVSLLPSYECSHDSTTMHSTFHPVPFVCAPSLVTLLTSSIRLSREFLRCCNG
jgi:choline dehydrogenase-like flavoprotein